MTFRINGNVVNPPMGWQGLELEINFDNNQPDASVKTSLLEWTGPEAALLNQWKNNGLTGGVGIYEGPPFQIEVCNPSLIALLGCINMTSADTTFQCDSVKASVVDTGRIQFMSERASAFSFAYLATLPAGSPGRITKTDYVSVAYVISTIPDYVQIVLLTISFLEMIKILEDAINTITQLIGTIAAAYPAVGLIVFYAILLILYIVYAVFILTLMVNIFLMLINAIIQAMKFKYGMRVVDLFTKATQYLNMKFSSTILQTAPYSNLVIIPKKSSYLGAATYNDTFLQAVFGNAFTRKYYDDQQNPSAYGYYEGTFAQLIKDMCDYFNATIRVMVTGGFETLYLERFDFWNNQSSFTMPAQSTDAPFEDPYGTNASELASNYFVQYTQDTQDENTLDQYDGTTTQETASPTTIVNTRNVLLSGLTQKTLPFALAKRKKKLSGPEQVINAILGFIAPIYNVVTALVPGTPSMPSSIANNRIGAMLLSSDFTSVQKILVAEAKPRTNPITGQVGYFVDANNNLPTHQGYTDAYQLCVKFHSYSWPLNPFDPTHHNQYLTYKSKVIPLCCSDFVALRNNNVIKDVNGNLGRVDSIRWNPFTESAVADFRVNKKFTTNIKQTIVIDGQ
jgi:hypothetical protein